MFHGFSRARYASHRHGRSFRVSAQQGQSGEGKRITQNEFTDKAWQSIIAAPDIAKQVRRPILPLGCTKGSLLQSDYITFHTYTNNLMSICSLL